MAAEFTIETLPDGQLKIDMGDMSGPHHCDAEDFISMVKMLMGGPVKTESKRVGLKYQPKVSTQQHLKH